MISFKELVAIEGKREAEKKSDPALAFVPEKVRVTQAALDKAFTMCRLVRDVHESSIEWYGFLLASRSEPDLARDFVFSKQDSSAGHTKMSGEDIARLAHEIEESVGKDMIVNGWIHSHAKFATFFSGIDQNNRMAVLNSVYANTRRDYRRPYDFMRGDIKIETLEDVLVVSGAPPSPAVHISKRLAENLTREQLMELFASKFEQDASVGFSYSIVVNEKSEYGGFVNWREWQSLERLARYGQNDLEKYMDFDVVQGGQYALVIDEEEMKKKIKDDIKPPYHAPILRWSRASGVWESVKGGVRSAEAESADDLWSYLGVPGSVFGDGAEVGVPAEKAAMLGQSQPATQQSGPLITSRDIRRFLYEVVNYAERQQLNYERVFDLRAIIQQAARAGALAAGLEEKELYGVLVKAGEPLYGTLNDVVYRLVFDANIVKALEAHAAADPDFAGFVGHFQGNMWTKHSTVEKYLRHACEARRQNKNAPQPEAKDKKADGNGDGGASSGSDIGSGVR